MKCAYMKTVYGPVPSWRLGSSLGIDLISGEKTCSFDCSYCQLGRTVNRTTERKIFVETSRVENDLKDVIGKVDIDLITFSGTGEPTLAKNLGDVIDLAGKITDMRLAILTNSSLLHRGDVRQGLGNVDIVVAKLDAPNQNIFEIINRPVEGITFDMIIEGILKFRNEFKGKFCMQMMFVRDNKDFAGEMAQLAREINPDEVQINTPLRPCPVKPLTEGEMEKIKEKFHGLNAISVYDKEKFDVKAFDSEDVLKRRPK